MQASDMARKFIAVSLKLELDLLSADTEILGNFSQFNSLTIIGVIESMQNEPA